MSRNGLEHLVRLFGTRAELARAIGIHKSAVHRWEDDVPRSHHAKIVEAGIERGLDAKELIWAVDAPRCGCCGEIADDAVRALVSERV